MRSLRVRPNRAGIIIVILLWLASWNGTGAAMRIGESLPSFTFSTTNGSSVRVPDEYRGKVLVFHFWAIGCSSCREEMPALDGLYASYHKKGLEVLAVNVGQKRDSVKAYAADLKVSYPILLDQDFKSTGPLGITDVPRTYIIDRNGVVRYRILGAARPEMLKKLILSLL